MATRSFSFQSPQFAALDLAMDKRARLALNIVAQVVIVIQWTLFGITVSRARWRWSGREMVGSPRNSVESSAKSSTLSRKHGSTSGKVATALCRVHSSILRDHTSIVVAEKYRRRATGAHTLSRCCFVFFSFASVRPSSLE